MVFAAAAAGKLFDLPGSRDALRGFGVGGRAVPIVAVLLPLAELATAIALVPRPSARWAAVAAALLLLAFVAGIAYALSRGRAPDCHCFGQLHSSPAGRGTLIRNLGLALLAGVVVLEGPGPALDAWWNERSGEELVVVGAAAAAVLLAATAARLWFDNRRLTRDLAAAQGVIEQLPPGLPVGALAPSFALPDTHGEEVTLESLCARGRPVVLLFMSPYCGPCQTLLPGVSRWQAVLADRLTIAIVSTGTEEENRSITEEGVEGVLLQEEWEAMTSYRMDATPSAVVVSPDGRIASTTVEGSRPVEPLVRQTLRRAASGAIDGAVATPLAAAPGA